MNPPSPFREGAVKHRSCSSLLRIFYLIVSPMGAPKERLKEVVW